METQAKFTPGPWKWEPTVGNEVEGLLVSENGEIVLSPFLTTKFLPGECGYVLAGFEFTEYADKPLIAAAPTLYGACQAALVACENAVQWSRQQGHYGNGRYDALDLAAQTLRAALAKAQGVAL